MCRRRWIGPGTSAPPSSRIRAPPSPSRRRYIEIGAGHCAKFNGKRWHHAKGIDILETGFDGRRRRLDPAQQAVVKPPKHPSGRGRVPAGIAGRAAPGTADHAPEGDAHRDVEAAGRGYRQSRCHHVCQVHAQRNATAPERFFTRDKAHMPIHRVILTCPVDRGSGKIRKSRRSYRDERKLLSAYRSVICPPAHRLDPAPVAAHVCSTLLLARNFDNFRHATAEIFEQTAPRFTI